MLIGGIDPLGLIEQTDDKVTHTTVTGYGSSFCGAESDASLWAKVGAPITTPLGNVIQLYEREMKYFRTQSQRVRTDYYTQSEINKTTWINVATAAVIGTTIAVTVTLASGGVVTVMAIVLATQGAATAQVAYSYFEVSPTPYHTLYSDWEVIPGREKVYYETVTQSKYEE